MELIAQMTEENTAASSNAADTAKKLDALSVSLLELVGRFKV
jgi:methyl-accepting chemotaxis protein